MQRDAQPGPSIRYVEGISCTALKFLNLGDVVYVDVPFKDDMDESKIRPSIIEEIGKDNLVVVPTYSRPYVQDGMRCEEVWVNGRRSYTGKAIRVSRHQVKGILDNPVLAW